MPVVIEPYIPNTITVHLGAPDEWAENVTVRFSDYVKNVASSEIFPTWEPAAIRANVLAIISFALNRVYTEFYPSRGYDFQITSTTAYDQKFIRGRNFFDSISDVVDEIFDDYIRRQGVLEPLAAKFCNGTTTTCDGLSQWGSQGLAQDGYNSIDILRFYYGNDIEIVTNAPIQDLRQSYPGAPLRLGSAGPEVSVIQTSLNRIAQNYPAIPRISRVTGVFDQATERSVREFQRIFNLTPDGVVGKATWYELVYLYVAVTRLAELLSEGQEYYNVQFTFPGTNLQQGDRGGEVRVLQYMLAILSEFNEEITPGPVDGDFGNATTQAVRAYQRLDGLTVNGIVDQTTWEAIYRSFVRAEQALRRDNVRFPENTTTVSGGQKNQNFAVSTRLSQYPGYDLKLGQNDQRGAVEV